MEQNVEIRAEVVLLDWTVRLQLWAQEKVLVKIHPGYTVQRSAETPEIT